MKLDAEFCESRCPVCTKARQGKVWAKILQRIELTLTAGGCPAGRDRQRRYGVKPNEKRKGV